MSEIMIVYSEITDPPLDEVNAILATLAEYSPQIVTPGVLSARGDVESVATAIVEFTMWRVAEEGRFTLT